MRAYALDKNVYMRRVPTGIARAVIEGGPLDDARTMLAGQTVLLTNLKYEGLYEDSKTPATFKDFLDIEKMYPQKLVSSFPTLGRYRCLVPPRLQSHFSCRFWWVVFWTEPSSLSPRWRRWPNCPPSKSFKAGLCRCCRVQRLSFTKPFRATHRPWLPHSRELVSRMMRNNSLSS